MQQTPWDSDYRTRQVDFDDLRSERSTSAPPPETSLYFGRNEGPGGAVSYLPGGIGSDGKFNPPFESRTDSLFLGQSNGRVTGGVPSSYDKPPPGFSSDTFTSGNGLSSSIPRQFGAGGSHLGSLDRQMIGDNLIRSQSAAPSLDGRLSMGLPPGLASSETPLVSNRSGGRTGESYLESAMDSSRILQLGQRRPASTGVIGDHENPSSAVLDSLGLGSSSGAVRPAAKTLMDLIQEDFPPESPMVTDGYGGPSYPRDEIYLERPRTTSPLSLGTRDPYIYEGGHGNGNAGAGVLTEALDRIQLNQRDNGFGAADHARPRPQYVPVDRRGRPQEDHRVQASLYAPVAQQSRPQPQTIRPQPVHFEQPQQQPGFGGHQSPAQTHVQTQVLPSGHTVYVNAPLPPQPQPQQHYGYATLQYNPHTQQHHIVHQAVPGGMPAQGEQFISVVPIQGAGAPVGPAGGSYAYWQPDGHNGAPQTLTILNAHGPAGVPMTVARVGNGAVVESPRQKHGGRGKEKGSKSRRGGVSTPARRGDSKHQGNAVCSPLLEEFKAKKNRDWTVYEIKGHVVEFCQDQNGSRFIQQRLEVGDMGEKEVVMTEVLPAVRRLRNDVFGNYVVQKLLDFGTPSMRVNLRDTLQGEMLQLSLQMYGCRVVQKALETLDETDVPRLLKEFHNNVLSCIQDQNGNHVIQKCIEVMSNKAKRAREDDDNAKAEFFSEQIDFIIDDVLGNVASLSCHPYGCRVLQRLLEHCAEPKKSRALDEIRQCHRTLLDDQYGNYVIQHVLQFGRHADRDSILHIVAENGLLQLSRQKFASNVVEKLLKYGTAQQRKAVVREMLKVVDERTGMVLPQGIPGTSVVLLMVRDAYANYVVQTGLDVITECEEKRLLLEELNAHSAELKNYTFAKHIVTKLAV